MKIIIEGQIMIMKENILPRKENEIIIQIVI